MLSSKSSPKSVSIDAFVSLPDDDSYGYLDYVRDASASDPDTENIADHLEINEFKVEGGATEGAEETSEQIEAFKQVEVTEQEEETSAESDTESEEEEEAINSRPIQIQVRENKKNMCPYCQKPQRLFARHVLWKHKTEAEVRRALSFPANSEERRDVLAGLIHEGNYKHNTEVLRAGRGIIIPGRCASKSLDASQEYFLPCSRCKGFFSRKNLYRHSCNASGQGRRPQAESKRMLPPVKAFPKT